jgi:hypothetical protein
MSTTKPPSESFQARQSQLSNPSPAAAKPETTTYVSQAPKPSSAPTILLTLLFLTNLLLIALLSILVAKVWLLENLVKNGIQVGGTVDVGTVGVISNLVNVGYVNTVVEVRAVTD